MKDNKKVVGYSALGLAAIVLFVIAGNNDAGPAPGETNSGVNTEMTASPTGDDPIFGSSHGVFPLEPATWANGPSSFRVLEVGQYVRNGSPDGGVITGGYLFPVGVSGPKHGHGIGHQKSQCGTDFFRPLILQFPDDLGRSSVARVDYQVEDPHLNVTPPVAGPNFEVDSFFDVFTDISLDGSGGELSEHVLEEYDAKYDGDYILSDMPFLEFTCNIETFETQKLTGNVHVMLYDEGDQLIAEGSFPTETFVFDANDHEIFADGFESGDVSAWSSRVP